MEMGRIRFDSIRFDSIRLGWIRLHQVASGYTRTTTGIVKKRNGLLEQNAKMV